MREQSTRVPRGLWVPPYWACLFWGLEGCSIGDLGARPWGRLGKGPCLDKGTHGPFRVRGRSPCRVGVSSRAPSRLRARAEGGACPRPGEATGLAAAGGPGACPAGSHWHAPSLTPPTVPTRNGRIVTPSSLPASPSTRTRAPVRRSRRPWLRVLRLSGPGQLRIATPKSPAGRGGQGPGLRAPPNAFQPSDATARASRARARAHTSA